MPELEKYVTLTINQSLTLRIRKSTEDSKVNIHIGYLIFKQRSKDLTIHPSTSHSHSES